MIFITGLILILINVFLVYLTFFTPLESVGICFAIIVALMSAFGYAIILNTIYYNVYIKSPKSIAFRVRAFIVIVLICLIIPIINYCGWGYSTGNLCSPDSATVYIIKMEMMFSFCCSFISFLVGEIVIRKNSIVDLIRHIYEGVKRR